MDLFLVFRLLARSLSGFRGCLCLGSLILLLLWDRCYAWSASLCFGSIVVVACIFVCGIFEFSSYKCVYIHIHMFSAREPAFSPLTVENEIAQSYTYIWHTGVTD